MSDQSPNKQKTEDVADEIFDVRAHEPASTPQTGEALAEEILGLNWRGFRTIWAAFVRPRVVFMAFAERDRVPYTPPIRIWFTLVSLQLLLAVLWGGHDGVFLDQHIDRNAPLIEVGTIVDPQSGEVPGCPSVAGAYNDFPAVVQRNTGECFGVFAELYDQAAAILQPPLFGLFSLLHIFVLGWLRPSLSWQARFNMTFLFQVVTAIVSLAAAPLILGNGQSSLILLSIMPVIVVITFVRTGRAVFASTLIGLWVKALAFATAWVATMLMAGTAMAAAALQIALWQTFG